MFVQVIQGEVSDAAQVRSSLEKWAAEVAPERSAGSAAQAA